MGDAVTGDGSAARGDPEMTKAEKEAFLADLYTDQRRVMTEVTPDETPKPTIGRIVIYKSKIDNGPGNDVFSPAVVIRTKDTCVEAVSKRWGPEPQKVTSASDPSVTHETAARPAEVADMLPDDTTVDLLVHGLGKDYREYNVKFGTGFGEWQWPTRG